MFQRFLSVLIVPALLAACSSDEDPQVYAVTLRPGSSYELPRELREISDLTATGPRSLACVQDELGEVFDLSLDGRVLARRSFGPPGDYEGLARAGEQLFVLRSDGTLLRLERSGNDLEITGELVLDLPHADFEGLGWDPRTGRLLIAPKDLEEKPGDVQKGSGKARKDRLPLYGYDPLLEALDAEPVLDLSRSELHAEAVARGLLRPAPGREEDKQTRRLSLRISAVAVDPRTGEFLLLSSTDRILLRLGRDGELKDLAVLDARALPQPEGLAVLESGELWIASEGPEAGSLHGFAAP